MNPSDKKRSVFFKLRHFGLNQSTSDESLFSRDVQRDEEGWEVWPEAEFEAAARQELQDEMNELERLSQEYEGNILRSDSNGPSLATNEEEALDESNRRHKHGREILPNPSPSSHRLSSNNNLPILRNSNNEKSDSGIGFSKPATGYTKSAAAEVKKQSWTCPICARPQEASDKGFNAHVDLCLSRGAIKEAVAGGEESASEGTTTVGLVEDGVGGGKENHGVVMGRKGGSVGRGRPKGKRKGDNGGREGENKKLFFGMRRA